MRRREFILVLAFRRDANRGRCSPIGTGLETWYPEPQLHGLNLKGGWIVIGLIYGGLCYIVFFLTFLYAIGFVGNVDRLMGSVKAP